MKKLFFIAALAGAALVSCTKNEVAPVDQQEITFTEPVISPATKVTEIANDYPTAPASAFSVWAHYYDEDTDGSKYTGFANGEEYMKEVEVKYNDSLKGWRNDGTAYYWPKNGSLTFIAYSPSSMATYADVDAKGIKFTDYVVGDAAAQVDLLYSERAYNKTAVDQITSAADPYAGVAINFKHALSSIMFKVKAAGTYTGTTLTVKKIEILNAYSSGDFTQNLTDANNAVTTAPEWSGYDVETNYTAYENATGITLTNTAVYAHNGLESKTENTTDLILLPQDLDHTATTNKVSIKVTYVLKNADMTDPITQVATVSLATGYSVSSTSVEEWEIGKRYTYTISVGLNEIYFDPTVEVWKDNVVTPDVAVS